MEAVHTPCGGDISIKRERAICNVCVHHYIHVCMSVNVDAYRYMEFHLRVHVCLAIVRGMVI